MEKNIKLNKNNKSSKVFGMMEGVIVEYNIWEREENTKKVIAEFERRISVKVK